MKRPIVVSLGEALWDLFPDARKFGGAPANFACHSVILGANIALVTAVGDDQRGREAIAILEQHEIDTRLIQVVAEAPTGSVGVEIDESGSPTFTIHEGSAWDQIRWSDELGLRLKEADAVYFGTLSQRDEVTKATIRRVVEQAKADDVPRLLDVNLRSPFFDAELVRESVKLASILKLSQEEFGEVCAAFEIESTGADEHPETSLRELLGVGDLDMVVMTCGADGAILVTPDSVLQQAGIPTKVVDAVGAGDAFAAAFLLGILRNEPLDQTLMKACRIAAATCAHPGAIPDPGTADRED